MDERSNTQPGAPPFVDEIARWYERHLAEIKRDLDEVNRKVDCLLSRPTAYHSLEPDDPFFPFANQILTLRGPLDLEESNALGT